MIRITSGIAKNKKLKLPDIKDFRASQDVLKQSIFSVIASLVGNAECLDLFAGSGSLGLEALSRGAKWCDFVDDNRNSVDIIIENIKNCGFNDKVEVFISNAVKYAANTERRYDLIFADPFYNDLKQKFLLTNLVEILKPKGIIIFSHSKELDINTLIKDSNLEILTQRKFGKAHFTILSKKSS